MFLPLYLPLPTFIKLNWKWKKTKFGQDWANFFKIYGSNVPTTLAEIKILTNLGFKKLFLTFQASINCTVGRSRIQFLIWMQNIGPTELTNDSTFFALSQCFYLKYNDVVRKDLARENSPTSKGYHCTAGLLFCSFGFSWFAYVEKNPDFLVWSSLNESNRRSDIFEGLWKFFEC